MYFDYWSGFIIAFLTGIYLIIKSLKRINSIEVKNYKKIGLYLNDNLDQYIQYEEKRLGLGKMVIYLTIESAGSWITILIHIIRYFYFMGKNTMVPSNVLNFNKEMSTKELNLEEINKLLKKYNLVEESKD